VAGENLVGRVLAQKVAEAGGDATMANSLPVGF